VVVVDLEIDATPEQYEIVMSPARMLGLFAGRRWGKSVGVVRNRIVVRCLGTAGLVYLLATPSYAQVKAEFDAMIGQPSLSAFIPRTRLQPYPVIYFDNGSVCAFRSLDRPNLLRGPSPIGTGYDEVWIDEVQDVGEDAYMQILRPLIADRRGTFGVSGQFRGVEHWAYKRFFEPGQKPDQTRCRSWRYPTSAGYSFRCEDGKAELAELERTTTRAVWEQEYLCLPTANAAAVFRAGDLEKSKRGNARTMGERDRQYVIGLDLGRVADPSALAVLDLGKATFVHEEERPLGEYHEIGAKYAAKLSRDFNGAPIICDVTGGATGGKHESDEFLKFYRKEIPNLREFNYSRDNKERIVHAFALSLEQGHMNIPAALQGLHRELSMYEYERVGDRYTYHGPKGHRDNRVSAAMMAWYAKVKLWFGQTGGISLSQAIG
jgi:hypothetical protein